MLARSLRRGRREAELRVNSAHSRFDMMLHRRLRSTLAPGPSPGQEGGAANLIHFLTRPAAADASSSAEAASHPGAHPEGQS